MKTLILLEDSASNRNQAASDRNTCTGIAAAHDHMLSGSCWRQPTKNLNAGVAVQLNISCIGSASAAATAVRNIDHSSSSDESAPDDEMHVEITRNPGRFGTPVDDVDHDQFQLDLISCSHQLLLRVTPDHQQLCGDSDLTSEHQYMADPESSKSSTEGALEYELDFDHQQHDRADVTLNSVDQFGAASNSTLLLQLANPSLAAASAHELQLDQSNLNLVEQSFFPAASDPLLHDTKNTDHDDDTHHNTRLQTPELHANDDQQLLVCELKAAAASSKGQLTVRLSNSAGPVAAATATINSSSFEVDPGSEQSHDHLHVINNSRYQQQQMMIHEHRATRDHNDDDNNNKCRRPMMFNTTIHEYCSSSSLQQDQYQDLSRRLAPAAGGGSKRKLAETGFNMSETAEWLQLSLGSNSAATTAAATAAAKMGCSTVLQGSDQAAFDESKLAFKTRTGSTPTSSTTSQQLLNGLTGPPIQLDHHHISSDQICPLSTNLSFGHAVSSSNNNTGSAFSNPSTDTLHPALVLATKQCDLGVVGGGAAGGPVPRDWSGISPHHQQYDPQSVIPVTVQFPRYFDEGGFLDRATPFAKQQNLSPMQQSTKTTSLVMRTDLLNGELMQGLDMQPSASPSIVHMTPELTGRQQHQVPLFECLSGNQMISSLADPSTSTTSLISWPFPEREDMTRVSKKPSQWVKQSPSDFALQKESQNLESETQLQYMEGMPAHSSGFSPSQFTCLESKRLESTANWKEIKFQVLGEDGHPAAQPAGHTTELRPKLGVPSCLPESSPQDLGQSQLIHMQPPDWCRGRLGWSSNEASWNSKNLAGCMLVEPTGNGVSGGLGRSVDSWQKLLKSVPGPNVPRCQPPAILSQDATHISALNGVLQEPPSHLNNEWIHRNEFNGELVVRSSPFGSNCGLWFTLQAAPNQTRMPILEQISKGFVRIRNEHTTVLMVKKYLAKKLGLESESQVEIACNGQQLECNCTLKNARDTVWQPRNTGVAQHAAANTGYGNAMGESLTNTSFKLTDGTTVFSQDLVMVLTYYSRHHQPDQPPPPCTENLLHGLT
ncbi:hypothetical protein CY35_02G114000 [Sphagnum magellanicum]|nr:hypothetical protein CY35_02G114000 [Sphagnum magellanicum]